MMVIQEVRDGYGKKTEESRLSDVKLHCKISCNSRPFIHHWTLRWQPSSWNLRLSNNTVQQEGIIFMCLSRTLGHMPWDTFSPAECHWERSARMFLLHLLEGWSVSNDLILCSAPLTLTNWYCTGHNVIRWLKYKSTQLPTSFHTKGPQAQPRQAWNWEKLWLRRQYRPHNLKHWPPPLTRNSHPGSDKK